MNICENFISDLLGLQSIAGHIYQKTNYHKNVEMLTRYFHPAQSPFSNAQQLLLSRLHADFCFALHFIPRKDADYNSFGNKELMIL